ncbi:transglutaminase family protein [Synechocystis sp. FACHB-383]|uniref:transglutaminase family protein n=1 Tax=Synechocystis sp. FACHB-383 TaxID=2692864 RepID=UPI001683DAE8|nr:transglutaminase family protein [Synechocystis sp. FACHB-383]MBD2652610.1 transglutaminase family protein [Synechocystis sp. FACHB-383]
MATYHIEHHTEYRFNQPVYLRPHRLRLRPRSNGWQNLLSYKLTIDPLPSESAAITTLDGNAEEKIWFTDPTEKLAIAVESVVQTTMENPFNFLVEPWALKLPFDYPQSLAQQLRGYLVPYEGRLDPVAVELAQDIAHDCQRQPITFLQNLTQKLYEHCTYTVRATGEPWEAGVTWRSREGSCRDLTVLFMEVCRAMGLAARFVSGYEVGDPEVNQWELHAWAEVYLPGAGWRGYDPTHGLAVGDRHIALVASAIPAYCSPVGGEVAPVKTFLETGLAVQSELETAVKITAVNDA